MFAPNSAGAICRRNDLSVSVSSGSAWSDGSAWSHESWKLGALSTRSYTNVSHALSEADDTEASLESRPLTGGTLPEAR